MILLSPPSSSSNNNKQFGANYCQNCANANKSIISPSSSNNSHHIPPFFFDFLNRLRQMTAELAAELSKFSGQNISSQQQNVLYGKRAFPSRSIGTKIGPRNKRRKTLKNDEENAKTISTPLVTPPPNDAASTPIIPTSTELLVASKNVQSQSNNRQSNLNTKFPFRQQIPQFELQNVEEERSNEVGEQIIGLSTPFAQRRKGKGPLSIRQRLGSSLAAAASAVNEQMPLEQLERTVSSVLPESIVESQDFTAYLREYLEEFDRELGQEEEEKRQKEATIPQLPSNLEQQKKLVEEENGFVQPKPERFVVIDEEEDEEEINDGQMDGELNDDDGQGMMNSTNTFQIKLVQKGQLEVMDQGRVILRTPNKKPQYGNIEMQEPTFLAPKTPPKEQQNRPKTAMSQISPKLISQRILRRSAPKGAKIVARKGPRAKNKQHLEENEVENKGRKRKNGGQKISKIGPSTSSSLAVEEEEDYWPNDQQNLQIDEENDDEERMENSITEDGEQEEEMNDQIIGPEMIDQILNIMHSN